MRRADPPQQDRVGICVRRSCLVTPDVVTGLRHAEHTRHGGVGNEAWLALLNRKIRTAVFRSVQQTKQRPTTVYTVACASAGPRGARQSFRLDPPYFADLLAVRDDIPADLAARPSCGWNGSSVRVSAHLPRLRARRPPRRVAVDVTTTGTIQASGDLTSQPQLPVA